MQYYTAKSGFGNSIFNQHLGAHMELSEFISPANLAAGVFIGFYVQTKIALLVGTIMLKMGYRFKKDPSHANPVFQEQQTEPAHQEPTKH